MGKPQRAKTACAWIAFVVAVLSFAAVGVAPASAADRAYAKRFGVNDLGDVRIVGNTSMSCPTSASCTTARGGTGTNANLNNDAWNMAYVDVDSDALTFSSSRATLDLPAGATVLFAGLYWGGDAPAAADRDEVKFDTPAPGGYQDLVATTLDTSTTTPTAYQGFRDVTGLVSAVGAGDYWAANVQGTAGSTNKHAGWALVVAYRDAASPRQNIAVFDGFQDVKTGDPHSATLTGLTTPASGTVDATVGVFAHEGDLGITGDAFALNATTLSNALNPANNAFNSSITRRGVRLSAKLPDYVNQFSVEMDTFAADAIVAPGATSATVNMTSTQDRYYPGVITYAGEAETVPPVTTIDSGPSGFTNDPTPTYAFSSNEAGSTFECRVDGGAWTLCTSPNTTASLADGSHTFDVRAIDVAGNTDPTPETRTITVDTVAPQTTIDSGPSGATNDATPTFGFSADQVGSTFECRIDGGAWASCTSAHTTASLADGAHTFEVRATDPAANVDATPASRSFTVDTVAPQTTIDSGPSGATNDATPTFGFSANQAGSTFECRVDAGAWASCTSAHTTASLADGAHTFEVRATDPAGNVDATPASRSFTVDTAAPQTTIDSGPSGPDERCDADIRVLVQPGRFDVRVPGRRRRLGLLQLGPYDRLARGRRAHLRGARDGPGRERRCHSGVAQLHGRHGRAADHDRQRPLGPDERRDADLRLLCGSGGLDIRVPRGRRRLGLLLDAPDHRLAGRRRTHLRRARDRSGRERRRHSGVAQLHGRHGRAADHDRQRPLGPDQRRHADLRLLRRSGGLDLRVPRRRRRVGLLHLGPHDRLARGRRPHLRGPRHRPGRERRPDSRFAQLHGRHGRSADHDRQRPLWPDE